MCPTFYTPLLEVRSEFPNAQAGFNNLCGPEGASTISSSKIINFTLCNVHFKENYSARQLVHQLNVDGLGEPCDSMLELRAVKIKKIFDATLFQKGTFKLAHDVEDDASAKSKCEHSAPSRGKK